ncbi:MAG: IclR family transcriptional regulator [Steroidobacteraceae bacterium]
MKQTKPVAKMHNDDHANANTSAAVKSADRVLDLFELLGRWDREMSHTEIAAALSIPKSSLTLLLRNLVTRGYVEFSSSSKSYRLGAAFGVLAQQSSRDFNLIACTEPILAKITATLGESSALNRLKGQKVEVVATVLGSHRLVSHMRLGDMAPLYATSGGKALLANLPEEMLQEYLSKVSFEAITPNTIKSVATLKREIEAIKRTGLAYSHEEFTSGIVGLATVIMGKNARPIGALNIAIPAVRSNREVLERAGQMLLRAAQDVVRQMNKADTSTRSQ